ncbi:hypothetical protein SAMN05216327_11881 [Dyadobacter sp. SG02]|nr:hypothetical protein SAMN05216327_11881 [Dyadobacter sp. SG02]
MLSDKTMYGLIVLVYCGLLLAHLWPFLFQRWIAYSQGRSVGEVPKPAKSKLLTGGLAFLSGVLWTWLYFRH